MTGPSTHAILLSSNSISRKTAFFSFWMALAPRFELCTCELISGIFSRRASRFWRFVIPGVIPCVNAARAIDSTEYDKTTLITTEGPSPRVICLNVYYEPFRVKSNATLQYNHA
jgi:hypothetical protein